MRIWILCATLLVTDAATVATAQDAPADRVYGYLALRGAGERYRAIASHGGWPRMSGGPRLEPGTRDRRIMTLRRRLALEGYSVEDGRSDPQLYDAALAAAVRRFQELHGLGADAVIGPATLAALNVSAAVRVRQIARNLERRRSLPDSLGDRYILVNSPAFTLDVIEGSHSVLPLRIIVGRPDWPTPMVSSRITELIFRPQWRVPRSIARREILPRVRRDSLYLARTGMRVQGDSAEGGGDIDPRSIDWAAVSDSGLPYRFIQEPGPDNPLGGVKFVLWTPFDVYLHDTPARGLFNRRIRAFSHGCVRVEHADRLAAYLLPEWPADSIEAAMTAGQPRRVSLGSPIPVHLVYWTAWVEDGGMVAFHPDVYHRDEPQTRGVRP